MLHDARQFDDGTTLSADLCVVGAGAAGITVARAFAGSGVRVLLLESGGLEFEDRVQELYVGENVGLPYFELDACRLRYFGGTTNHWAGRCRPLDPHDFEAREWVPLSGWPIGRADLDPYYRAAHELCQLGPYAYAPEAFDAPPEHRLALDPDRFPDMLWQYSPPTRFGELYRDDVARAENADVVLHANLLDIDSDDDGRVVEGVTFGTLDGKRHTARARLYVLACGGLENPRLLLASNSKVNVGLGNQHDMVGRCFMDHPHLSAARVLFTDRERVAFYDYSLLEYRDAGWGLIGGLHLAPALQRREKVLNYDANLTPDNIGSGGYAALRRVWNAFERGDMPDDLTGDLWQALLDVDDTFAGLLGRLEIRDYRPEEGSYRLWSFSEQAPNRDSRVLLGDAVDPLGLPRLRLDWRMMPVDKRTLQVAHRLLAEELGRTGLGRVQVDEWLTVDDHGWGPDVRGGFHHMGATRMAANPEDGVVDAACRVHGVDNLYIAGSSVFPTGGSANPTLTIVALALRLAEELRARLVA